MSVCDEIAKEGIERKQGGSEERKMRRRTKKYKESGTGTRRLLSLRGSTEEGEDSPHGNWRESAASISYRIPAPAVIALWAGREKIPRPGAGACIEIFVCICKTGMPNGRRR